MQRSQQPDPGSLQVIIYRTTQEDTLDGHGASEGKIGVCQTGNATSPLGLLGSPGTTCTFLEMPITFDGDLKRSKTESNSLMQPPFCRGNIEDYPQITPGISDQK